ncbi:hypothetical protein KTG55_02875 [Acinetobacter pittii]|uniref:hypothetical protein n=1 Tax=Acinetobacter pittii TaxID=48296 RepID=UPI0021D050D8|nr:hypothetical protein [Acinetobacter pittii]MCU4328739.1 hypothetical protein [Acinetobacter pittii]
MKKAVNIENCHNCNFTMKVNNSEHAINIESSTALNIESLEVQNCQKGVSINDSWNIALNDIDINLNPKSVFIFKKSNLAICVSELIGI